MKHALSNDILIFGRNSIQSPNKVGLSGGSLCQKRGTKSPLSSTLHPGPTQHSLHKQSDNYFIPYIDKLGQSTFGSKHPQQR